MITTQVVPNPNSLLTKYFTQELKERLAGITTTSGYTIDDVVRSGVENPDSSVGVYAGDTESYEVFSPLLEQIITDYHGFTPGQKHVSDFDISSLKLENLDPEGKYVVSTRIRVGRNLAGFAFPGAIAPEERVKLEGLVIEALSSLTGELAGHYYSLSSLTETERQALVDDHFLFKQGDRFLESAGINRNWPEGRGIFHSDDKRFLVWINEEDSLRIISMQEGADIKAVFERLAKALSILDEKLAFAKSDHLGYLTSCPTNLGTAMRASVHIRIPKLGSDEASLKALAGEMGLSVRGIHGEHSESAGGVFDISNKARLGITESKIVEQLAKGVSELIRLEKAL